MARQTTHSTHFTFTNAGRDKEMEQHAPYECNAFKRMTRTRVPHSLEGMLIMCAAVG
jgi:hypothetical protein